MSTSSSPLVSLLIPIYKVERYVEECLRSVLVQDYPNLEVILVDDCSPDRSIELAMRVIQEENERHHTIQFIRHEQNRGSAGARISSLEAAHGQYLLFLDSDDYYTTPTAVSTLVQKMRQTRVDVVVCGYKEQFKRNQRITTPTHTDTSFDFMLSGLRGTNTCYLWNKCFRRDLFMEKANRFQLGNNMWEDVQAMVPYLVHAKGIAFIDSPLICYRRTNEHSISLSPEHKNVESMHRVLDDIKEYLADHATPDMEPGIQQALAMSRGMIDTGVLCNGNFDTFRQIQKNNKPLELYARHIGSIGGRFIRASLRLTKWGFPHLGFAVLRLKEQLQSLR